MVAPPRLSGAKHPVSIPGGLLGSAPNCKCLSDTGSRPKHLGSIFDLACIVLCTRQLLLNMRLYSWSIAQQLSWCIRALAPYNSLHEQKCSLWKASQRQPETLKTNSHSLFSLQMVETTHTV